MPKQMHEQRSHEWFAQRVGRITGSRVGAVLGLSPFQSRKNLIAEMVDEANGVRKDLSNIPAIKWGVEHEDQATREFEFMNSVSVEQTGQHDIGDWGGASPDGLIGEDQLLEIKCPYTKREATQADDFKSIFEQPHYIAQIQMQLAATDRQVCYFYQWSPNAHRLELVKREAGWLETHMPIFVEFLSDYEEALELSRNEPAQGSLLDLEMRLFELMEEKELLVTPIDAEMAEIKEEIANLSNGAYKGTRLTVNRQERKGSISYQTAAKQFAPEDIDWEEFRGKPTSSIVVRKIKQ